MDNIPDPFFKWTIRKNILNYLYLIPANIIRKQIRIIVKETARLTPGFSRNSEAYLYHMSVKFFSKEASLADLTNNIHIEYTQVYLVPETKDRFITLFEELNELTDEQEIISSYLTKIINKCNTTDDFVDLLPKSAHKFIPQYSDTKSTLSEDDIREYRQSTYKYAKMLNQRIIMNLITTE